MEEAIMGAEEMCAQGGKGSEGRFLVKYDFIIHLFILNLIHRLLSCQVIVKSPTLGSGSVVRVSQGHPSVFEQ